MSDLPKSPLSREETYLAKITGQDVELPPKPLSRSEQYLAYIAENGTGGGSGGTTDYAELTGKPKINGVELSGNKTASDLNLAIAVDPALSVTSENPVQNKAVKAALDSKITMPSGGTAGQVLKKTASGTAWGNDASGDAVFVNVPEFVSGYIKSTVQIALKKAGTPVSFSFLVDDDYGKKYDDFIAEVLKCMKQSVVYLSLMDGYAHATVSGSNGDSIYADVTTLEVDYLIKASLTMAPDVFDERLVIVQATAYELALFEEDNT